MPSSTLSNKRKPRPLSQDLISTKKQPIRRCLKEVPLRQRPKDRLSSGGRFQNKPTHSSKSKRPIRLLQTMRSTPKRKKVARKLFESPVLVDFRPKLTEKKLLVTTNDSIRINRGRIFNWFFDVFSYFHLRWETFWCAVEIFDFLAYTVDCVRPQNVHLKGLTCIFMASKIHETLPPRLRRDFIHKAAHGSFTKEQILEQEKAIMDLCFNRGFNLQLYTTVYNLSHQLYPTLPHPVRMKVFCTLLWVMIDPELALNNWPDNQIWLEELVIEVTECSLRKLPFRDSKLVEMEFIRKHGCKNLENYEEIFKLLK